MQKADATYIYEFKNEEEAKENLQNWAKWEMEMLEEAEQAPEMEKKQKKYVIDLGEAVTILIQKDNYVFYGRSDTTSKVELEKLAELLGF